MESSTGRGREPGRPNVNRRAVLALAAYAGSVALLLTPVYEPLTQGRDDSWAIAIAVGCAHVGVAVGVARIWVLALPVGLSLALFFASGGEALSWLLLFFAMPVLIVVTFLGWGAGRVLRESALTTAAAVAFLVAAAPAVWAALETVRRDKPLPDRVQASLPLRTSLGNLCPNSGTAGDTRFERQSVALLRELDRRPYRLVTYTYYYSDEPEEEKEITVRELAEEQLSDLDSGGDNCAPELQRRLRDALD